MAGWLTAVLRRGALALLVCAFAGGAAGTAAASGARITPIKAVFVPSELATHYTVGVIDQAPSDISYKWKLELALVDPAGAPAPASPEQALRSTRPATTPISPAARQLAPRRSSGRA